MNYYNTTRCPQTFPFLHHLMAHPHTCSHFSLAELSPEFSLHGPHPLISLALHIYHFTSFVSGISLCHIAECFMPWFFISTCFDFLSVYWTLNSSLLLTRFVCLFALPSLILTPACLTTLYAFIPCHVNKSELH